MTIVSLNAGMWVKRQDFGIQNFDLEFSGGDNGASQVAVLGPPRWTCSLVADDQLEFDQASMWRSLALALKGRVNFIEIYDILNKVPMGSLRGSLTMAAAAAAGADTLSISAGPGQVGATLRAGDWIGVNQGSSNRQLLHVQADAAVAGNNVITVTVQPNLRVAVASGTAVAWNKPTCLMRRNTQETGWNSTGAVQGGFNLDLIEAWF